jgi:hypothetical protein
MIVDRTSSECSACECSAGFGAGVGACRIIATTFCRDSGIDTECSARFGAGIGACGIIATIVCRDSGIDTARCGATIFGRGSWKCSVAAGAKVDPSPATATGSVDEEVRDVRKIVRPVILRATPKHTVMRRAEKDNPFGVDAGSLWLSNVLGKPWQNAHSCSDMLESCIHMMLDLTSSSGNFPLELVLSAPRARL